MANYKCSACGKIIHRTREWNPSKIKQWLNSYCEKTGRDVRIYLIKRKRL